MLTLTKRSSRRRAGFTLVEILVGLAIIAVLVAIMLPTISSGIRNAQTSNLEQNLKTINDAIQKYRENVGYYPSQLALLIQKPTTSNTDACGATLTSTAVALWKGPYLTLRVGSSGVQSGEAIISNALLRSPTTTSSSTVMEGELMVTVTSVYTSTASDLEDNIDAGSTDYTAGTIRYTPSQETLRWNIPISGC